MTMGRRGKNSRIAGILLAMALVFTAFSGRSEAVLTADEDNQLFFQNAEVWIDADQSGAVSQGDLFFGILSVQNILVNGVETISFSQSGTVDSFTGYFITEVESVDATTNEIIFKAVATDPNGIISDADLADGAVIALYRDTGAGATGYQTNDSPPFTGDDIALATDGDLWAILTLDGGYWYSIAPLVPPTEGDVGESFLGLNFLVNNTGFTFGLLNDPTESLFNLDVQFFAQSEIEVGSGQCGTYPFCSNDPATVHPLSVPEPSSMILLGVGLLGSAAWLRRRSRRLK